MHQEYLRVTEIFHSIQGESTWAGLPCTFIRLTGCPLRCVWCDTEYSFQGGEKMALEEIRSRVREADCSLVELTGGEPLIHPNAFRLVAELLDEGYTVLVETSGAVDVGPLDPRAHRTRQWLPQGPALLYLPTHSLPGWRQQWCLRWCRRRLPSHLRHPPALQRYRRTQGTREGEMP
jgi:hypothetical protein